jgi:hypothetical protein
MHLSKVLVFEAIEDVLEEAVDSDDSLVGQLLLPVTYKRLSLGKCAFWP